MSGCIARTAAPDQRLICFFTPAFPRFSLFRARWPFLLSRHPLWAPLSVATFACCGSVVKLFHKVGLSRSTLYGQEHLPLLEGKAD